MTAIDAKIVEDKIDNFVTNKEMFTSVDISNAIKNDGTWIRNREIAGYLRTYDFSGKFYNRSTIHVIKTGGGTAAATLYHPDYADPANYTKTSQKTISKKEVDTKYPASLISTGLPPINSTKNMAATLGKRNIVLGNKLSKRIRINKTLVKQLGLNSGDNVDPMVIFDNVGIFKTTPNCRVTKDGRINIMRSHFDSNIIYNDHKVKVDIINGKVAITNDQGILP